MSVVNRQFDGFEAIEAAEKAVDVAVAAMDAARDRLCKVAETLRQAENNLVKMQEKHGIPVPQWPEHQTMMLATAPSRVIGRRWWAAEVPDERPKRIK